MRTTIDIPDSLARRAKIHAVQRDSTLKNLIVLALEKELAAAERVETPVAAQSSGIHKLPVAGRSVYSLSYDEIDRILHEEDGG